MAHARVPNFASSSHRWGLVRHYHNDAKRRGNVTFGRARLSGRAVEENPTRLRAVAHPILGSLSEADGAVQEAWLRLGRSDTRGVEILGGWLTKVVARVCAGRGVLHFRSTRRPQPSGPNGDDALDAYAGRQLGDATVGSRGHVHPLEQRAATLWYQDHRTDSTGPQSTRWTLAPDVGIPPQAVSPR